MATTNNSGFWPTRWGDADPSCSAADGQPEGWTEEETRSCLDLAAIYDAFDSDDPEPLPEHGDFWEQFEEEEQ
jgi:hypothetical protein